MFTLEEIANNHNNRLMRAGDVLWNQMILHFDLKKDMSGEFAMKLMDTYGIRYQDLIFLCATHGICIEPNSLHRVLCEREERPKTKLCTDDRFDQDDKTRTGIT